jgi:hypothetical protein
VINTLLERKGNFVFPSETEEKIELYTAGIECLTVQLFKPLSCEERKENL